MLRTRTRGIGKRILASFLFLFIFVTGELWVHTGQAFASERIKVLMSGKELAFDKDPVIENGTTLVQFRPIFERLGLKVTWDGETQTVTGTQKGTTITLTIGQKTAIVNGQAQQLEAAPELIDGYTFVPLRLVGESSSFKVEWDEPTHTVKLTSTLASAIKSLFNEPDVSFQPADGETGDGDETPAIGKLVYDDGTVLYEGRVQHGVPNGSGVLTYEDLLHYEGFWENGLLDGFVRAYNKDKVVQFEGQFSKGMKVSGKQYDEQGHLLYDGQFEDRDFNGQGKLYASEGFLLYDGEWVHGKRQGKGKIYDDNGLVYEGTITPEESDYSYSYFLLKRLKSTEKLTSIKTKYFDVLTLENRFVINDTISKLDGLYEEAVSRFGDHPPELEGDARIPVLILPPQKFNEWLFQSDDSFVGQFSGSTMFMKVGDRTQSRYVLITFRHELVHAFTYFSKDRQATDIPAWFIEGAAVAHENDKPYSYSREDEVRDAVRAGKLIPWERLVDSSSRWKPEDLDLGYAQAGSMWSYLSETYGEQKILEIYRQDGEFDSLMKKATGKSLDQLEADWKAYVNKKYK